MSYSYQDRQTLKTVQRFNQWVAESLVF